MMDISIDELIRLLLEQMQSETAPEQSDKVDSYFVKNGEELFFKLENYTAAHNIYTRTDDEVHITGPESFWFYVNRETADGSSKQLCRVDMVYQDVIMVGNKIWKMQSITPVTEE